jgi:hypothetical protein
MVAIQHTQLASYEESIYLLHFAHHKFCVLSLNGGVSLSHHSLVVEEMVVIEL